MGFRRILAGIYTQTSAHIVGAPMAHYNAINGSRFNFSFDCSYLPVHGLEGMLKGTSVVMTFKNLNGNQLRSTRHSIICTGPHIWNKCLPTNSILRRNSLISKKLEKPERNILSTRKSTFFISPREWCIG